MVHFTYRFSWSSVGSECTSRASWYEKNWRSSLFWRKYPIISKMIFILLLRLTNNFNPFFSWKPVVEHTISTQSMRAVHKNGLKRFKLVYNSISLSSAAHHSYYFELKEQANQLKLETNCFEQRIHSHATIYFHFFAIRFLFSLVWYWLIH